MQAFGAVVMIVNVGPNSACDLHNPANASGFRSAL